MIDAKVEILDLEDKTTPKAYLARIVNYFKCSTQENSIIFNFEMDANYCHCKVIKYEVDGSKEELEQETFSDLELVLTDLLEPFLKNFSTNHKIVINSIQPAKNNTSNLKVISEQNDMCNIIGLKESITTRLSEKIRQKENNKTARTSQAKSDQKGVGNTLGFIISLLVVGTVILGLMFIN